MSSVKFHLGWCAFHTILTGAFGIKEQYASSQHVREVCIVASFLLGCLMSLHLLFAAIAADEHRRLKVCVPGCATAAMYALALRVTWLVLNFLIDLEHTAIAWEVFLLMVFTQAGIFLELATGYFQGSRVPSQNQV